MQIEAFILTGGRSSRMGRDKAAINLGGTTLAERAADTIRDGLGPVLIRRVTACDEGVPAVTPPQVRDIYPDTGAVGAVHAALFNAGSDWAFVIACDLPFVTPDLLRRLFEHISIEAEAVVPVQADARVQPLCAFYRIDPSLSVFEAALSDGEITPPMHKVLQGLKTVYLPFEQIEDLPGADRFFMNVNTPEDLRRAESQLTID